MNNNNHNMTSEPYLPEGLPRPVPRNDDLDEPYWSALKEHRLLVQKCDDCGTFQWGPEWICHHCLTDSVSWVDLDARGTIYSWERVWHPVSPALASATPYVIVLVDMVGAPGVRMIGNLLGDPTCEVQIGAEVVGVFEDHDEFTLLQFATETQR